jgi:hypothetical protein
VSLSPGQDVWCGRDYQPGRIATPRQNLALALYRRLITSRGTLRGGKEEESYGLDVEEYVGSVGTDVAIAALPALIAAECSKDNRVASVSARVIVDRGTNGLVSLTVELDVVPSDDLEDFTLALRLGDDGLRVEGGV